MHEFSIMQSALHQVLSEATKTGAARIHQIRLRVGVLSGVVPDSLQFAFDTLKTGTAAEGAVLTIEEVPARFWCAACQREFVSPDFFAECPDCHKPSGELRGGRELELSSMEVDHV
jgi:hydrogenase nickel incorporation protein HypA/HybF